MGWLWAPALAASVLWNAVFTAGWMELLPREEGRPGLGRLFLIRQGGETINFITPLGTVGGEPVKVMLLDLPAPVGTASVVAARTFHAAAQIAYGASCLLILLSLESFEGSTAPLFVTAALVAGGIGLFILIQKAGVLRRLTERFSGGRMARAVVQASDQLQRYYERPFILGRAFGLFLTGWIATSLEPMVVLYAVGLEDWGLYAVLITGLISLLSTAAVLVPASLGVMEGGLVGVFNLLGLDPVLALTVVVVRRVRELVWVALGTLCLWLARSGRPGGAPEG